MQQKVPMTKKLSEAPPALHLSLAASRRLCAVFLTILLCCLLFACAGRGDIHSGVHSNPALELPPLLPSDRLWVDAQNSTESTGVAENLRNVLVAFLQSDAGIRIAESEAAADYILQVHILQVGLSGSMPMDMDFAEGMGSAASGAMLGLGIGGAISPEGAGWGAGAGLLVGLGIGYASTASDNEDIWTMQADIQLKKIKNMKNSVEVQPTAPSKMEVSVQGANLDRERAIPALEDALAQEIAKHFIKEPS